MTRRELMISCIYDVISDLQVFVEEIEELTDDPEDELEVEDKWFDAKLSIEKIDTDAYL